MERVFEEKEKWVQRLGEEDLPLAIDCFFDDLRKLGMVGFESTHGEFTEPCTVPTTVWRVISHWRAGSQPLFLHAALINLYYNCGESKFRSPSAIFINHLKQLTRDLRIRA